jgi:hypothetical protein
MRTIQFSQILNEAVQLCGLDRDNLQTKTFKALRDIASNRLNEIWNREQWPFLVNYYNASSGREVTQIDTTAGSSQVTFLTLFSTWNYESLNTDGSPALINVDTTIANQQFGAPLITGSFPYIGSPSGGQTITLDIGQVQASTATYTAYGSNIGSVWSENDDSYRVRLPSDCEALLGVFTQDPRATTKAINVGYYIESLQTPLSNGLFSTWYDYAVLKEQLNCWLQYRVACPLLKGDQYSATTTYAPGDQAYYLGDFYTSKYSGSGIAPSSSGNTAYWTKVVIPELFRAFLVRSMLADYLRSESQYDQAAAAEVDAQANYERAVDFVMRQEQQSGKLNMVFTY